MTRCHKQRQCSICEFYGCETECSMFERPTNADHIRAVSDEELAELLMLLTEEDFDGRFCRNLPECDADISNDR